MPESTVQDRHRDERAEERRRSLKAIADLQSEHVWNTAAWCAFAEAIAELKHVYATNDSMTVPLGSPLHE